MEHNKKKSIPIQIIFDKYKKIQRIEHLEKLCDTYEEEIKKYKSIFVYYALCNMKRDFILCIANKIGFHVDITCIDFKNKNMLLHDTTFNIPNQWKNNFFIRSKEDICYISNLLNEHRTNILILFHYVPTTDLIIFFQSNIDFNKNDEEVLLFLMEKNILDRKKILFFFDQGIRIPHMLFYVESDEKLFFELVHRGYNIHETYNGMTLLEYGKKTNKIITFLYSHHVRCDSAIYIHHFMEEIKITYKDDYIELRNMKNYNFISNEQISNIFLYVLEKCTMEQIVQYNHILKPQICIENLLMVLQYKKDVLSLHTEHKKLLYHMIYHVLRLENTNSFYHHTNEELIERIYTICHFSKKQMNQITNLLSSI